MTPRYGMLTICPHCLTSQPKSHRCGPGVQRDQARRQWRTRGKGYKTTHWKEIRAAALARDRGGCVVCGTTEDLTVDCEGDHAKARLSDVMTLCRRCHGVKDGGRRGRFFEDGVRGSPW